MNKGFHGFYWSIVCSCLGILSVWSVSLIAGEKNPNLIAEAGLRGQSLEISLKGSYDYAVVKVMNPNGASFTKQLENHHNYIDFGQFGNAGMIDGNYTYELHGSFNPQPVSNGLNNGRGDMIEYKYDTVTQSGSFMVKNGVIVNSRKGEE